MNVWKAILATLVIFGAGVVTGGLLVRYAQHGKLQAAPPLLDHNHQVSPGTNRISVQTGPRMPGMRGEFLKNLECEVELTPAQRERIEKILATGQERTKALWDTVAPQVHEEWGCVKNQIRAELADEQKLKFDEFMKRPKKNEKSDERRPSPSRDDLPRKEGQQAPAAQ